MDAARSHKLEFLGIFSFAVSPFCAIYSLIVSSVHGLINLTVFDRAREHRKKLFQNWRFRIAKCGNGRKESRLKGERAGKNLNNVQLSNRIWTVTSPIYTRPITFDLFHFLQNRFASHFSFTFKKFESSSCNFMNFFNSSFVFAFGLFISILLFALRLMMPSAVHIFSFALLSIVESSISICIILIIVWKRSDLVNQFSTQFFFAKKIFHRMTSLSLHYFLDELSCRSSEPTHKTRKMYD